MKRNYKDIRRATVITHDKVERAVSDLLLDRRNWSVRYAVIDTGGWLTGRQVLISPAAFGPPRWSDRVIPINTTAAQIEKSPPIESDMPVTLAHERALMEHYQWPPPELEGPVLPDPIVDHLTPDTQALEDRTEDRERSEDEGNPNLFSAGALLKLTVFTRDGQKASLDDIVIEDDGWRVVGWIVDARPWLPGGTALLGARAVSAVDVEAGTVTVGLERSEIEGLSAAQTNLQRAKR